MRKSMTVWMMFGAGMLAAAVLLGPAQAQDADTGKTTASSEAAVPPGQHPAAQQLMKKYGVSAEQIDNLRQQNMGFGEIDHALGIAAAMPEGLTDANLQKVTDLRSQNMGWGEISKQELGVSLGELKQRARQKMPTPETVEGMRPPEKVRGGPDRGRPEKPVKFNGGRPGKGRPVSLPPAARGKQK